MAFCEEAKKPNYNEWLEIENEEEEKRLAEKKEKRRRC